MAVDIKVPSVGESVAEGTLSRWLKQDGATVRADEPLLELETDKATQEVAAPGSGTLRITVPEGQTVTIGTVVGRIEDGIGDDARGFGKPAVQPEKREPPKEQAPREPEVALSPAVRRLVREKGIDARELKGTGPGNRITPEDVLDHLATRSQTAPAQELVTSPDDAKPQAAGAAPREVRKRMSSIRQRIAERLVNAQRTAAILTTFNEVDMSAVIALRTRYKEAFQKKHGVGLGFMSFFVKAAVEALRSFPVVNAWIEGNDVVYHDYHHIGVAVSTDKGLMVPVLHDAERLSFAAIEKTLADLAQKARAGKVLVTDLQGGTFTITNGGVFGSLLSTPILNPPQSAILGMHAIQKRPVAVDDQVVIRPMMYLALSYDHRLVDGREAVLFLARIKECIENPERMFLEI